VDELWGSCTIVGPYKACGVGWVHMAKTKVGSITSWLNGPSDEFEEVGEHIIWMLKLVQIPWGN
jgi:hypothetical protein